MFSVSATGGSLAACAKQRDGPAAGTEAVSSIGGVTPETSLYRRHRPQGFDEVVGQEPVVRTLRNAIERDRVHHAYLFVGSRGTGKTSLAKILARSLNCVNGPTVTPCGECESCRAIAAGTSLDVIEMDAASNRSVDDIRELRERVGYAPAAGHWKVYILDEAHMLTREAWNAFLKTLEEPPPNTVFVLATTEPHKVMPTIVDRCQRFDFQRPSAEQIAGVVSRVADAEGIDIEAGAVVAVSRAAAGSFRDALGTLDQLVSYGGKKIQTDDVLAVLGVADAELILDAADALAAGDARGVLEATERLAASGHDVVQFGRDLLAHLRELLVVRTIGDLPDTLSFTPVEPERLKAQASAFTDLALGRSIDAISKALADVREGDEPRMTLELALMRAARPELDPSREALAQRVERLEQAGQGSGASPDSPSSTTRAHAPSVSDKVRRATPPHPAPPHARATEIHADQPSETRPEDPVGLELEKLQEVWPAVVEQVRESGSELLSHVLAAARPVGVDAKEAVLKIGFPASAAFNKRKAEATEARDRIGDAVRTVVGDRLRPVYVLLEGDEGQSDAEASQLSEEELIARLQEEFGAEEVDTAHEAEAKEAEG
jgi:DNA polymerase-3 subunit gamma/tau